MTGAETVHWGARGGAQSPRMAARRSSGTARIETVVLEMPSSNGPCAERPHVHPARRPVRVEASSRRSGRNPGWRLDDIASQMIPRGRSTRGQTVPPGQTSRAIGQLHRPSDEDWGEREASPISVDPSSTRTSNGARVTKPFRQRPERMSSDSRRTSMVCGELLKFMTKARLSRVSGRSRIASSTSLGNSSHPSTGDPTPSTARIVAAVSSVNAAPKNSAEPNLGDCEPGPVYPRSSRRRTRQGLRLCQSRAGRSH